MRLAVDWQTPMMKVLAALAPLAAFAVYRFGWRVLVLLAACNAAGFADGAGLHPPLEGAGLLGRLRHRRPVRPVAAAGRCRSGWPWSGVVFGVLFGKMVFGGFGRNVFNPALTGRAFIYVSFGGHMTAQWAEPYAGLAGRLRRVRARTPSRGHARHAAEERRDSPAVGAAVPGTTAGVIGGTSAAAGACWAASTWSGRKAANYRIVVSRARSAFALVQTLCGWPRRPAGRATLPARAAGRQLPARHLLLRHRPGLRLPDPARAAGSTAASSARSRC